MAEGVYKMKTVSYRTYQQALKELRYEVSPDRDIEVYEMNGFGDDRIQLGINWSAIGTVSADETRKFAQKLMDAANAVENFKYNGYTVTYNED